MSISVGIAGAGLFGRLLALELQSNDFEVTLFDRDRRDGTSSCGWTGAGMIAPVCELETGEHEIEGLGLWSLDLWPELLALLDDEVFFQRDGTLAVAHSSDRSELELLVRRVSGRASDSSSFREIGAEEVARLEPALAGRFSHGVFFPGEGQVDNRGLYRALRSGLLGRGVGWEAEVEVVEMSPHTIVTSRDEHRFDVVVDCRGLGAKVDLPGLRGVRGELVLVRASDVSISRPVRLMHPRHPLYVVPRPDDKFVIGATSIDSEDFSPISVQGLLELLSAAYVVHPGFAEARVLDMLVNCRPAFPDHRPRMYYEEGLVRVNGLYRHGFLISPALARACRLMLEGAEIPALVQSMVVSKEAIEGRFRPQL